MSRTRCFLIRVRGSGWARTTDQTTHATGPRSRILTHAAVAPPSAATGGLKMTSVFPCFGPSPCRR
jgi:hypothetical protein